MLKVERDLRDRALKCMVRGLLMAEFREVEVFDPIALFLICMFCVPEYMVLFLQAHAPVRSCKNVIKTRTMSSRDIVLRDSCDLPVRLCDRASVVEKFIFSNREGNVEVCVSRQQEQREEVMEKNE